MQELPCQGPVSFSFPSFLIVSLAKVTSTLVWELGSFFRELDQGIYFCIQTSSTYKHMIFVSSWVYPLLSFPSKRVNGHIYKYSFRGRAFDKEKTLLQQPKVNHLFPLSFITTLLNGESLRSFWIWPSVIGEAIWGKHTGSQPRIYKTGRRVFALQNPQGSSQNLMRY